MSDELRYRRVLLKLSGEALSREGQHGVDPGQLSRIAAELAAVQALGVELAVVVGGGNFLRGATVTADCVRRSTADGMGMLATVMNGLALRDAVEAQGVTARLMSAIPMGGLCEVFSGRKARRNLREGRILILSGGTGSPFVTTDSAAALRAAELEVDAVLKATKVDGVYSADPKVDPTARRYDRLTYQQVLDQGLRALDLAAVAICMENRIPVVLFNLFEPGNVEAAVRGKVLGTVVSHEE